MAEIKRFAVCMVCGRSCIVEGQGKPVCGEEHRQLHTRAVGTLAKLAVEAAENRNGAGAVGGVGDSAAVLQAEFRVLNLRHRIELWPRPYWQPRGKVSRSGAEGREAA